MRILAEGQRRISQSAREDWRSDYQRGKATKIKLRGIFQIIQAVGY